MEILNYQVKKKKVYDYEGNSTRPSTDDALLSESIGEKKCLSLGYLQNKPVY